MRPQTSVNDARRPLDEARRIASTYDPLPPVGARERVWQRIERENRAPWFHRVTWAQAGLVAACAAALWYVRMPTTVEAPQAQWVSVRKGAAVDVSRATVAAMIPSTVRTPVTDPTRTVVQLVDGALKFDVLPRSAGQHFDVETRHAIVRVVGTKFDVETDDDGTRVRVEEGVVEVTPRGGDPVRLTAGTNLEVAPQRRAVAPIATVAPPPAVEAPTPRKPKPDEAPMRPATPRPPPKTDVSPVDAPRTITPPPETAYEVMQAGRDKLQEARLALDSDASKAATLAEQVIEETPGLRVDALAVLADARRRAGDLEEAARLYRTLAEHPNAPAYEEEALLRLALVLRDLGRAREGEAALNRAHDRLPHGPLAMERAALAARLALADGDPGRAATAISRAPSDGVSIELLRARIDVAEVLVLTDKRMTRSILSGVERRSLSPDLAARLDGIVRALQKP